MSDNQSEESVFSDAFLDKLKEADFRAWCKTENIRDVRRTCALLEKDFDTSNDDGKEMNSNE
jgi:hypothetical protein